MLRQTFGRGDEPPRARWADTLCPPQPSAREFAARAKNGRRPLDILRAASFTFTTGGVSGSLLSTPLLTPPQVGILGLHKIEERPMASKGQVVIRPMMYLALSYDHRIIDGREAVTALVRMKECLEDPERILLDL